MLKTLFAKPRVPKRPARSFDEITREWTTRDWADLPVQRQR